MVYILHGHPMSTCTRRVLVSFIQMGLEEGKDFKMESVAAFTDIKTPEWIKHQPFGQMPYLEDTDNGAEVFESRAIARYVAAKIQSPLLPSSADPVAYGKFEQAASTETANFDPSASGLAYQLVFGPGKGIATDEKVVETQKATLAAKLKGYEALLSKTKYIAGDEITLIDLFHLPYAEMAANLKGAPALTDGSLPNVSRWWNEISSLESWKAANAFAKR